MDSGVIKETMNLQEWNAFYPSCPNRHRGGVCDYTDAKSGGGYTGPCAFTLCPRTIEGNSPTSRWRPTAYLIDLYAGDVHPCGSIDDLKTYLKQLHGRESLMGPGAYAVIVGRQINYETILKSALEAKEDHSD